MFCICRWLFITTFLPRLISMHNAKMIYTIKIQRMTMPWRTSYNVEDCGVYLMWHMESYRASTKYIGIVAWKNSSGPIVQHWWMPQQQTLYIILRWRNHTCWKNDSELLKRSNVFRSLSYGVDIYTTNNWYRHWKNEAHYKK